MPDSCTRFIRRLLLAATNTSGVERVMPPTRPYVLYCASFLALGPWLDVAFRVPALMTILSVHKHRSDDEVHSGKQLSRYAVATS